MNAEETREAFIKSVQAGEQDDYLDEVERVIYGRVQDKEDGTDAVCPSCGHPWNNHDREIKGVGKIMLPEYNPNGYEDLYECNAYAGMGDWCGCEKRSRRPVRS